MNRLERGPDASNWTPGRVLERTLRHPSVDALLTESRLTFLAFARFQDDLQANLTDKERVQVSHGSVTRAQVLTKELLVADIFARAVLKQNQVPGAQTRSLTFAVFMNALTHVLEDATISIIFKVHVTLP